MGEGARDRADDAGGRRRRRRRRREEGGLRRILEKGSSLSPRLPPSYLHFLPVGHEEHKEVAANGLRLRQNESTREREGRRQRERERGSMMKNIRACPRGSARA